jgi:hypothetical protein
MAQYIAPSRIADAVKRLSLSGAKPGLSDFLVLKRTIVLQGAAQIPLPSRVVLSMRNAHMVKAIEEFMLSEPTDRTANAKGKTRFFNPFGAARDTSRRGYRNYKYDSNGIADTVTQEPWGLIVAKIPGTTPRAVELNPVTAATLTDFLLLRAEERPRLDDTAIWYFRASDVSEMTVNGSVDTQTLGVAFLQSIDLSAEIAAGLFETAREVALHPQV